MLHFLEYGLLAYKIHFLAEELVTKMVKYNIGAVKIFRNTSRNDFSKYNFNELNASLSSFDSLPSSAYLVHHSGYIIVAFTLYLIVAY